MKNRLTLLITLVLIAFKLFGQETSKIQIDFQTKSNVSIPLFRQIYLGDINTDGWDGRHYNYQHGTLTKNEFLFNAPHTDYFEKDKPIVLVMSDNLSFIIDPKNGNQRWLLTPSGQDYNKSLKKIHIGGWGIFISTLSLFAVVIDNVVQTNKYNTDKNYYNEQIKMGFNPDSAPKAPRKGALYLIPAITYSISIP